jgi:Predicted dehydrogenases and related proteins
MKIGILGTGMIVKDLLTIIDKLSFEHISLLGTEQTRDETLALKERYALDEVFFNYDEMLMSDVDVIYVALPNHLHFSFAEKALQAGKHVIIEKPIVLTTAELIGLKRTSEEMNCFIFEAMNIHHLGPVHSIKNSLSDLGDLKLVSLNYSQFSSRYLDFKNGITHPAFDPSRGGGAMLDINVYNLHMVIGIFGRPVSYTYLPNIQNNVDTSGVLIMNYPTFKAVCIGAKDCQAPTMSTIQGEKGCIILESPVNTLTKYKIRFNDGSIHESEIWQEHRLIPEFKEFIRIINYKDKQKAYQLLESSIIATEILETISKQVTKENSHVQ